MNSARTSFMHPKHLRRVLLVSVGIVCSTFVSANESLVLPSGHVCRPLAYPAEAIRSRAEGTTVILYEVRADGSIPRTLVQSSAGKTREHKMLDRVAVTMLNVACKLPPETSAIVGAFRYEHVSRLPSEPASQVSAPAPTQ
jgi:TonB family protein